MRAGGTHDDSEELIAQPSSQLALTTCTKLNDALSRIEARLKKNEFEKTIDNAKVNTKKIINKRSLISVNDKSFNPKRNKGKPSHSIIHQAQLSLFQSEQEGRFSKYELAPSSEFPTLLTRLPIFIPSKRCNQRGLLDDDNSMPFETPWGNGRKHGPPLTVYDEDTLIAIGRLRQNRLIGRPHNLPVPVSELYRQQGPDVSVHVLHCMLSDIQAECGASQGGKNNQLRLDSIKRLGATVIEFSTKTAQRYIGSGAPIKIFDLAWQEFEDNAILYIQFSPVMAAWYEKEYTIIDWVLRKKLSDTGKAIHRFLASQPRQYEIYCLKLMQTIGYMREYKKFMADLRDCMDHLCAEGWISEYRIEGSGRKTPQKLIISRRKAADVSAVP